MGILNSQKTDAQAKADRVKSLIKAAFTQLNLAVDQSLKIIWQDENPQEILNEFGIDAKDLFTYSAGAIQLIEAVSDKRFGSVVPDKYTYAINPDGSVTVTLKPEQPEQQQQ